MPGGGEWINTIGEGEQEKRKRAFAETLQSQEPKHWIWKGELEACMTWEAASFQESYGRVLLAL